tara:strand:+ start:160 stop:630 length:471 start_codon:yes stop_codon:yes gene_type:complete
LASTTTSKLGLFKPVPGTSETFRAADFNGNMDLIDAEALSVDTRLDTVEAGLDTVNVTQSAAIDALELADIALDGRLDSIEAGTDAVNVSQTSRLGALETYDIALDGRLDTLEALNISTRLTTGETTDSAQNNRLAVLEIAAGSPPIDFSVDGGTP